MSLSWVKKEGGFMTYFVGVEGNLVRGLRNLPLVALGLRVGPEGGASESVKDRDEGRSSATTRCDNLSRP